MMRYVMRYFGSYICWILLWISWLPVHLRGQELSDSIAKRIVDIEYRLYNTASLTERNNSLFELAEVYTSNEMFDHSIQELKRMELDPYRKADLYELDMALGKNHYLKETSDTARIFMEELMREFPDSCVTARYTLLNVLILNDLHRWKESESALNTYFARSGRDLKSDTAFTNIKQPHTRSIKKAKRLSLIPGAGLIYAGENRKAVGSIALISLFAAYTAVSAYYGYYVSAFFTGFTNTMRFYYGGNKAAVNFCEKKNKLEQKKAALQLDLYAIAHIK